MNKHERIILEKLTENPMLSQSELAQMLNITRSSVSVYISYLMQKGYIRGRGYIVEDKKTFYIIGSTGIDYQTAISENHLAIPYALDGYDLLVSYGGISKNIAESLTRLGLHAACISAVGSDLMGQAIIEECKKSGVECSDFLISPTRQTSTYLEIRSLDFNKILFASANMKLQQLITPDFLTTKQHKLKHAELVIIEDSLSSATLQYVSSMYSNTLFICTKPSRISRYSGFLNQINGMLTSLENAAAILDRAIPDDSDSKEVFRLSKLLQSQLSGPLLICYGKDKFCYTDQGGSVICTFSDPSPRTDLFSHYRDTVAAGFIYALSQGFEPAEMLKFTAACRQVAAESSSFRNQHLCIELLETRINKSVFSFLYS